MTGDAVHSSSFVGGNEVSGFFSEQSRNFGRQLGGPRSEGSSKDIEERGFR